MLKKSALFLLIAGRAFAAPTIYPANFTLLSTIKNNTTSNLIADSVDSRRIYVMPPSVATANVEGLHTFTANLGFCREMADDQVYSAELTKKIKDLMTQEIDAKKEADEARKKLLSVKEEAAKFAVQARLQDLVDMDNNIANLETRLSDLYEEANSCKDSTCDLINQEIDDLIKQKSEIVKNRRAIAKEHAQDIRTYERFKSHIQSLQENFNDLDTSFQKLRSKITQVRKDFLEMYESFGKMEGARAAISFKSDWDKNVSTLRSANPDFEFEKIQTQKAQVLASINLSSQIPGAQAIIAYEVGGQNVNGTLALPSYPDSIAGNVVLSLVGACPAIHPDWFKIPDNQSTKADKMNYGLTVSYEYPSVFSISAKAKYNMYKIYQKIVESGSSGGFFSSKSWTSVEESNFFRDSFKVTWDETDPSFSLPDLEKAQIESEMRKHIFDRIATIALPQAPDRNGIIQSVNTPKHGALALSDSLMTACPGNVYCVGGSIALSVLDAIFGSSSTSSSYMQTYDMVMTEDFSRNKVIFKPAITSYQ